MSAEPRPFVVTGALLLLGVQLLAMLAVVSLGSMISGGESIGPMFEVAVPVVAPLVAIYVGLTRYAPAEATAAALRLQRPEREVWPLIALAFLFGLAASPVLAALVAKLRSEMPAEALSPEARAELQAVLDDPVTLLVYGYAEVLVVPLVDEALFRGFIQPRLAATFGGRRAVAVTLLFYVAAQMHPLLLPLAVLFGLPLGLIALASGTTWASYAGHVALAGAVYLGTELDLPFVDADPSVGTPIAVLAGSVALAGGALALIWRLRRR